MCHEMYDRETSLELERCGYVETRGHSLKLKTHRCKYDVRKYFFGVRVVGV